MLSVQTMRCLTVFKKKPVSQVKELHIWKRVRRPVSRLRRCRGWPKSWNNICVFRASRETNQSVVRATIKYQEGVWLGRLRRPLSRLGRCWEHPSSCKRAFVQGEFEEQSVGSRGRVRRTLCKLRRCWGLCQAVRWWVSRCC